MGRPLIALLTDFGLRDHYVGAMKGVIAGLCPEAALVDITHDVPAHDIVAGSLVLEAAAEAFPPGTVFLCVVDPGVGTSRRAIAARVGEWIYVGPDNGLLTLVARGCGLAEVVELTEPRFGRAVVSRTFEGRDRFAPAAAWLAAGTPLREFGAAIGDVVQLDLPEARIEARDIAGEVLIVDHFGNLVTNIRRGPLESWAGTSLLDVSARGRPVGPLRRTYADVAPGEPLALIGSSGRLEIACNGRNASDLLQLGRGGPVRVRRAG